MKYDKRMLFDDSFRTVSAMSQGVYRDRGSKFMAYVFPVKSEAEVKACLAGLRKEHYGARHHCYAYRLGADKSAFRTNDDGEPAGTGGKPIYNQILSFDLTNVLVVVVRYFGGTLLGVSGLIAAYKGAAKEALDQAEIISHQVAYVYRISFPCAVENEIIRRIKDAQGKISDKGFDETCFLDLKVPKAFSEKFETEITKIPETKFNFAGTSII